MPTEIIWVSPSKVNLKCSIAPRSRALRDTGARLLLAPLLRTRFLPAALQACLAPRSVFVLGVATWETTPHMLLVARGKNHRPAPPLNGEAKKMGPPGGVQALGRSGNGIVWFSNRFLDRTSSFLKVCTALNGFKAHPKVWGAMRPTLFEVLKPFGSV